MQLHNRAVPLGVLVAGLLTLGTGCASAPASPLQQARNDAVRRLTVDCYWEAEGERLVFGPHTVHGACRRWAESRVRVRMPPDGGQLAYD